MKNRGMAVKNSNNVCKHFRATDQFLNGNIQTEFKGIFKYSFE
jgi:hypothetical protein